MVIMVNVVLQLTSTWCWLILGAATATAVGAGESLHNGPKIVGGSAVTIEAYPYQVGLLYYGDIICGGSIIDSSTILTAAHCIVQDGIPGTTFRSDHFGPMTQIGSVSNVIIHSGYNSVTNENDIAIVKLATPLTFNSAVQAIVLPAAGSDPAPGSLAMATGWGSTTQGGRYFSPPTVSEQLLAVQVPIVSHIINGITSLFVSYKITPGMVCAGEEGSDTCQGDSGGPLASTGGIRSLIGITSFGFGCGKYGYPGVYTRVSEFRSWITTNGGV